MKSIDKKDVTETHPLFPSGEWEGFYTYAFSSSAGQHKMSFVLNFQNSLVEGSGCDDIDMFSWHGMYDMEGFTCKMTKHYYGRHSVYYTGHVDENGIWGTWTIGGHWIGGFHIWPKASQGHGEIEENEESMQDEKGAQTTIKIFN
jgi:hypothetical protein